MRAKTHGLVLHMTATCLLGIPTFAWVVAHTSPSFPRQVLLTVGAMTVLLVIGEMFPIAIPRRGEVGDELSVSSTLAVALLFVSQLGVAVLAQAIALTADEFRSRRNVPRLLFNIAQYTISLTAAKLVYSALSGAPVLARESFFPARSLPWALVACCVFFPLNNGLTGTAVALKLRLPVIRQLVADVRWQIGTAGVLLALAPAVAQAVQWSPWTLLLMSTPLFAVHRSAAVAFAREHEALHDALTGLANRVMFDARLQRACVDAETHPFAVAVIDLDHFKHVNDTLGHYTGDLLIAEAARRVRAAVRDGDLVARLGGDEFAILATRVVNEDDAAELAQRVNSALAAPFTLDRVHLQASCSIGFALAPRDGDSAQLLLQRADVALYEAKTTRGTWMTYAEESDDNTIDRLELTADLHQALTTDQVFVIFQPKCDAITGEVFGVEALVRWHHPRLGLLAPDRFIGIAEGTGLIDALTDRVLELALAQVAQWRRSGHDLTVAVNLSARCLLQDGFAATIGELLARHDLPGRAVTLEVTETMLMADTARTLKTLRGLRDLGVRLSIDDFGTGYSSLAYLKRLQVHELKIDRGFVAGMRHDPQDEAIVRTTIQLGHEFGLEVVAEGVEDFATWNRLVELGCDVIQGFILSPPEPAHAFDSWLAAHRAGSAPAIPHARVEEPAVPAVPASMGPSCF